MTNFRLDQAIAARRLGAPQRSYLWRVLLPDIQQDNLFVTSRSGFFQDINYEPYQTATGLTAPSVLAISNRVKSISVPFVALETDKQTVGSSYWYYGKKNDIGSIQMEILEYEDGATFQYLTGWQLMSTIPATADNGPSASAGNRLSNTVNPPMFYKFPIYVFRLDTKKLDLYMDTYDGFFLTGIAEVSSDYDNSAFLTYSASFTGDSFEARQFTSDFGVVEAVEADIMQQVLKIQPTFTGISVGDLENLVPQLFQEIGSTL